jgi:alkylation response protein AidB-like acyl-CoA dehydrogenase
MDPTAAAARETVAGLRPDLDDPVERTARWLHDLHDKGFLDLPLPGRGSTAERFAALRAVGAVDLDLARLVEAHTDALAVLADLDVDDPAPGVWGIWAANPPTAPLVASRDGGGWRLTGTKPWCSGAGTCDHALVTARSGDGYRLFAVDLDGSTADPVEGTWPSPALPGSDSRSVRFDAHPAEPVGEPEAYLRRPGFWHGAVGVAAVWLGGATAVASALTAGHARRSLHPHALAHTGAVDAALAASGALLHAAARAADADPSDSAGTARLTAGRVRAVVERTATEVIDRVGRALGPAPLATDPDHARAVAGLMLYVRQSHAERDLEEQGGAVLATGTWPR